MTVLIDDVVAQPGGTAMTGTWAWRITASVTEPTMRRRKPVRPCVPMTGRRPAIDTTTMRGAHAAAPPGATLGQEERFELCRQLAPHFQHDAVRHDFRFRQQREDHVCVKRGGGELHLLAGSDPLYESVDVEPLHDAVPEGLADLRRKLIGQVNARCPAGCGWRASRASLGWPPPPHPVSRGVRDAAVVRQIYRVSS